MIKYLKPLELFRETIKRTYHMPSAVFLGLSVTDKFASLAISDDCYLTARTYGLFQRNETLLDRLVDRVQSLKKDYGYELEGIIVAGNNSVAPPVYIHNLMDEIWKKEKLESLKYTYWRDNFTSSRAEYKCNQFGSFFCGMTFPIEHSEQHLIDVSSAVHMLQTSLDVFNTLVDSDEEEKREDSNDSDDSDGDEEREDSDDSDDLDGDEEREDSDDFE